jgi:hypothetical protein
MCIGCPHSAEESNNMKIFYARPFLKLQNVFISYNEECTSCHKKKLLDLTAPIYLRHLSQHLHIHILDRALMIYQLS